MWISLAGPAKTLPALNGQARVHTRTFTQQRRDGQRRLAPVPPRGVSAARCPLSMDERRLHASDRHDAKASASFRPKLECIPSQCFLPAAEVAAIRDERAQRLIQRLQRVAADETICFYTNEPANLEDTKKPALVLIHGFDSSCLEFRALLPELERLLAPWVRLFAVDVFGWGFGARPSGLDYGPAGKRAHLKRFLLHVVDGGVENLQTPLVLAGASLGGAVLTDYVLHADAAERERIRAAIFIDAQLFVDGKGFRFLVPPLDCVGLWVLRSAALRQYANKLAFYRPSEHATEDALRISRLPCLMAGWMEASRSFLRANGYTISEEVAQLACFRLPVLAIWGAEDRIVPLSTVERLRGFYRDQSCADLVQVDVIPECGHLPHLERPEQVASIMDRYVREKLLAGDSATVHRSQLS
jgi:pimeloyl-ACP methyl ester carboxylesterase